MIKTRTRLVTYKKPVTDEFDFELNQLLCASLTGGTEDYIENQFNW